MHDYKNQLAATKVCDADRYGFLTSLFEEDGRLGLVLESVVFGFADRLIQGYKGGYWDFFRVENGAFFLAPVLGSTVTVQVAGNGFEGAMSCEAAGVVVTLFALTYLAEQSECEPVVEKYHALRDYAAGHVESEAIMRAIN